MCHGRRMPLPRLLPPGARRTRGIFRRARGIDPRALCRCRRTRPSQCWDQNWRRRQRLQRAVEGGEGQCLIAGAGRGASGRKAVVPIVPIVPIVQIGKFGRIAGTVVAGAVLAGTALVGTVLVDPLSLFYMPPPPEPPKNESARPRGGSAPQTQRIADRGATKLKKTQRNKLKLTTD